MPPWMIGWRMPKSSVMRVFMLMCLSPGFHVGAQVHLERPRVPRLGMQVPVVLGDVLWVQNSVLLLERVAFREVGADELRIDGAVDNDMGDVDAPRPQFARHALGQCAQGMFGAREGCEVCRAADACRRAGEEDRAAPPCNHLAGD